jgi:hypothetical protein
MNQNIFIAIVVLVSIILAGFTLAYKGAKHINSSPKITLRNIERKTKQKSILNLINNNK